MRKILNLTYEEKFKIKNYALSKGLAIDEVISSLIESSDIDFVDIEFKEVQANLIINVSESENSTLKDLKKEFRKNKIKINNNEILRYMIKGLDYDKNDLPLDEKYQIHLALSNDEKKKLLNYTSHKKSKMINVIKDLVHSDVEELNTESISYEDNLLINLKLEDILMIESKSIKFGFSKNDCLRSLIDSLPDLEDIEFELYDCSLKTRIDTSVAENFKNYISNLDLKPGQFLMQSIDSFVYDHSIDYMDDESTKTAIVFSVSKSSKNKLIQMTNEHNVSMAELLKNLIYSTLY